MREDCCGRIPHDSRCPYADEPKVVGKCVYCNEEITAAYEYYTDNEDNMFCSTECALKYHGIKMDSMEV